MIEYDIKIGDVTQPNFNLLDKPTRKNILIPHVCNNIGLYGAGVAKAIAVRWPQCALAHSKLCSHWEKKIGVLGQAQFVLAERKENHSIIVVNMMAQSGVRSRTNKSPIKYSKLRVAMENTRGIAEALGTAYEIHCPRFGVGLAGGEWSIVEKLIKEVWCAHNIRVYIYALK